MNDEDESNRVTFEHYCTCGGYAHSMNGRDPRRPHLDWCPQREEYNRWYDATHPQPLNA